MYHDNSELLNRVPGHGGAVHELAAAEGEVGDGGDGAAGRAHRHAAVAVHRGAARRPRVRSAGDLREERRA